MLEVGKEMSRIVKFPFEYVESEVKLNICYRITYSHSNNQITGKISGNKCYQKIQYDSRIIRLIQDMFPDEEDYRNIFINPLAENLYHDIQKSGYDSSFLSNSVKDFKEPSQSLKQSFWFDYAAEIPEKLRNH